MSEANRTESAGRTGGTTFTCSRCGRHEGPLPKAPFRNELGERIHANVCAACWKDWIRQGTIVINEFGLVLHSAEGQQVYDEHMKQFLNLP